MNQMRNIMNNMSSGMGNMGGMGGGLPGPLGNIANLMTMFNQFVQNPVGAIMGMGYNVPQNVQNGGPEAIVNYLRSSGQMSEQQFNQFSQLANSPIAQQLQNSMKQR